MDAHYGLAQCYTLLGGDLPETSGAIATEAKDLATLGKVFAGALEPLEARLQAAVKLSQDLEICRTQPSRPAQPKLPLLLAVSADCRAVYRESAPPALAAAAAHLLGKLHLQAHSIYKPDDIAESRSKQLYRAGHPAANNAAEAIVIYPLQK